MKHIRIETRSFNGNRRISKHTIDSIIAEINSKIGTYTYGGCLEDEYYSFDKELAMECVDIESLDESRWSVQKKATYKIGDFYIACYWDDPATECQEGQDTNCEVHQVFKKQKTITVYE